MNIKAKIFGGTGVAAIVVAGALAVGGATHARAADVAPGDVIFFTGTASSVPCTSSGPIPAEPSCNSGGIPYVGGSGSYSFATGTFLPVGCETVDLDASSPASGCTISSSGHYTNVVCGTGLAQGSATISGAETTSINSYTIAFVGGVGVLAATSVSDDDGTVAGAGVVDISPTVGGNGGTSYCTSGFNVVGVAAAL